MTVAIRGLKEQRRNIINSPTGLVVCLDPVCFTSLSATHPLIAAPRWDRQARVCIRRLAWNKNQHDCRSEVWSASFEGGEYDGDRRGTNDLTWLDFNIFPLSFLVLERIVSH